MARKIKKNKHKAKSRNHKPSSLDQFIRAEVLEFLKKNRKKSYTIKQIAAQTGLWQEVKNSKIRASMDFLTEKGKLSYIDKGRYQYLGGNMPTKIGEIQVTKAGFGFLLVDDDDDIFIPANALGKAMDKDTVKVKLTSSRKKKGGKQSGEVIEIIQRNRTQFVGVLESVGKTHFMISDDPRVSMDFYISSSSLNGAEDGDKILTELVNWDRRSPEVKVLKVIGKAGEHNTEMHALLYQYGFDPSFPHVVEAEAESISAEISASEIKKRRDMRGIPTFTIDPDDAKDFDDALSFKDLGNGRFEVGIHIADVSHYVKPGTEIDKEGFLRATSVYLVDRTVPMLPEALSNNLCSLRPHEDKLTFSAIFEMDKNGKVYERWFGRTIIHSDHRFTYAEAEAVLKEESDGPMKEELLVLNDIAYKLREKRFSAGSIDFDSNEVKFVLDEEGKPIQVIKKERGDSNKLIEDFMLLANREVAAYVAKIFDNPPLPFVYRIHDLPDPEKLYKLQEFVKGFGYEVKFDEPRYTSEVMNKLMEKVAGAPEQNVIETIAIRSMAKAIYTTNNIGHYGLGFEFYTHFTSPIRRYPDLLVHRLLARYQSKEYSGSATVLEEQLKHCSARERTAAEAERASIKYKQVEFLEERIGEEYDGVISGVIEAGFFVELDENLCEGMVPIWSIENEFYTYDEANYAFHGRESGQTLRLGDKVRIKISGTDMKKRTIDMAFVEKLEPVA